jgi:hypothetical protein
MSAGVPDNVPTPSGSPTLSLIIPAFNEADRLDAGFARLGAAIESGAIVPEQTQFIVVDDGSNDQTSARATALFSAFPHASVLRLPNNRGKGAAVRAGVAVATAPIIAFADADMAIDPDQTPTFLAALDQADIAIGSRAATGAHADRPDLRRSVMNRMFNHLVNAVTQVGLDDTQCGFKAFRGPVARLLFHCSTTERMAFDVEILTLARRLNFSIAQVPVQWSRVDGSRVSSWSDSRSMVGDVMRTKRKWRAAPPVASATLTLTRDPEPSEENALAALARVMPVFRLDRRHIVVAFPLMDDMAAKAQIATLRTQFGSESVAEHSLSLDNLRSLTPLTTLWPDRAVSPDRA